MRTPHALLFLVSLLLLLEAVAFSLPQSSPSRANDKETTAIAQTVERFVDAWNKHDTHAFALTFTEDADFTNVVGDHAQGRANVESFHAPAFAGIFKESHQTAKIRSIRFLTADLAAVDVDWEMTGVKSPDGTPRPDRKGLLNWVMAMQTDGAWLILIMHNTELTNRPAPPK
jgi:uncharacterized protein (TIGR02246 family)